MKRRSYNSSDLEHVNYETIGDSINLPVSQWQNYGDLDYLVYGGDQLRWDGDSMVEIFTLHTPDGGGEGWHIMEGAIWVEDLIENAKDLNERYGDNPSSWPAAEATPSKYAKDVMSFVGQAGDDYSEIDMLSVLLGVSGYGGYTEARDYIPQPDNDDYFPTDDPDPETEKKIMHWIHDLDI